MLRRRMLSQMPLPPSGNVNDAYFYVEAPWIKDLSKYNMNVDESMYMDIDKYNGKYVFSMGRVGAYNSYIKFDNDSNILPCPQPDNEISIEALLYLNTQQEGRYYLFAPYGTQSTTQDYLCIGVNVSSFGTKLFLYQRTICRYTSISMGTCNGVVEKWVFKGIYWRSTEL